MSASPLPASAGWIRGILLGAGRRDPLLILVLLLPFVILLYDQRWIITFPSYFDPWYSIGYFLDLPGTLHVLPHYYVSDRLAYWIPGALTYAVLPPLLANYVLRLSYFLLATVSLYLAVSRTLGRKTAFVAAFLLSGYWHFHREMGWNYVDGAGIAYLLAALAALAVAAESRWRRSLILLAGVWFGAAVNTNLFLAALILPLAFYHVGLCRIRGSSRRLGGDLAAFVAGALCLTGLLGLYFYQASGKMLLSSTIEYITSGLRTGKGWGRNSAEQIGRDVQPFFQWFKAAHWLELPLVVGATGLLFLTGSWLRRRWGKPTEVVSEAALFQWVYLLQLALFAVLQMLGGNTFLIQHYASYQIPLMFLALAGQIYLAVERLRSSTLVVLCLAAMGFSAYFFRLPLDASPFQSWCHSTLISYTRAGIFQALIAGALVVVGLAGLIERRLLGAAGLAGLLAILAFFNYTRIREEPGTYALRRDSFQAIFDAVKMLHAHGCTNLSSVQFWYQDVGGPDDSRLFESINSVYLWGYSRYGTDFPQLPHDSTGKPLPPERPMLALLALRPGGFEEAQRRLRQIHVEARFLEEKTFHRGDVTYTVTLMENLPQTPHQAGIVPKRDSETE